MNNRPKSLDNMSNDAATVIALHLDPRSLARLACASRNLNKISSLPSIWKKLADQNHIEVKQNEHPKQAFKRANSRAVRWEKKADAFAEKCGINPSLLLLMKAADISGQMEDYKEEPNEYRCSQLLGFVAGWSVDTFFKVTDACQKAVRYCQQKPKRN